MLNVDVFIEKYLNYSNVIQVFFILWMLGGFCFGNYNTPVYDVFCVFILRNTGISDCICDIFLESNDNVIVFDLLQDVNQGFVDVFGDDLTGRVGIPEGRGRDITDGEIYDIVTLFNGFELRRIEKRLPSYGNGIRLRRIVILI